MKLKFKVQPHQTLAVNAVVDCFAGQPMATGLSHRTDASFLQPEGQPPLESDHEGYRNASLVLSEIQILENIQKLQRYQNLPVSQSLTDFTTTNPQGERQPVAAAYKNDALAATRVHLDVEMETGTGKTYCYIKTIFEMNKRYGWSKFIIMVPSIAIREGVYKSLQITADHFHEGYGKKARFFVYNSKHLHELESFSSDAGIKVMVINIQAFNAATKRNASAEARRIFRELDDFQSRRPIDVIASSRPILILDEPQKMEGGATLKALIQFKPLFILRYSATHRTRHNLVHRLDALDAYNQKLVKKIAVRGIQTRQLAGTNAYLYLEGIDFSKKAPVARMEMEVRLKSGKLKRQLRRLEFRDDLYLESGKLDQYRGFTISQIDAINDTIEFSNGIVLRAGEANGDVSEEDIRRIQIRETIKAHLDKEKQLFAQGIKVLSLFFIDGVVKYRDYDHPDEKGEYARIFEEEYEQLKSEYLSELALDNEAYRSYLADIAPEATHKGYFSIDRKTNRLTDPIVKAQSSDSDDVSAYDLILKDKERLLSFEEPTRFIFSHSALREGWDNPNVFVMCMLKHGNTTISRRQEVGRGLRLCVNRHGDRIDHPAMVHDINVLTVVASESYRDFVSGLQEEIAETLTSRPRQATEAYFTGKFLLSEDGPVEVTARMAKQIYRYLLKNDYTDDMDQIADAYHEARESETLAELPPELERYAQQIFALIDSVFSEAQLPRVDDARRPKTNPLNANFEKHEFQELWARINRQAVYRIDFDSAQLIRRCISALDSELRVTRMQYSVQTGIQSDDISIDQLRSGDGFKVQETATEYGDSRPSRVKYDLVGKIAESTKLTRQTVASILSQIQPAVFQQFHQQPEHFISEASRIIVEHSAATLVEHLKYEEIDEQYGPDIFTLSQSGQDFSRATGKLEKHVYDHAITDSEVERRFVEELDTSSEVAVYAKLPRSFLIPTPVGDYNPDWAICFKTVGRPPLYVVAETKGSSSSAQLRGIEKTKIACARKFFEELNRRSAGEAVQYEVVTDYAQLRSVLESSE